MADLRALAPAAGQNLPLVLGEARLTALADGPIWAISPYPGQAAAVAARLGGFPAPGRVVATPAGRLVWAGRETAFLFGTAPDLAGLASVADQSDGWCGLGLVGDDAAAVLARLVPLDLAALTAPAAVRSQLNHMPLLLIHRAAAEWELWSYRSMAGSMVHEVDGAMRTVAARRARG